VLGAVSPDYPNLARDSGTASQWADAMHGTRACEMITSGIRRVRVAEEAARDKQLAWLLGYCAHVVTDATIHPIRKVVRKN
jgi:Zinc dependent phospholipase C